MIRVLFVDDDPQAQKTLAMVLADGYAIVPALTAAQGLGLAAAERPDVVLLDIDLPDGSGLDLLEAILVLPDPADDPWPAEQFLRQGVRAQAWVLLNQVSLGYEWWRQLNGFPPVVSPKEPKSDIARKRLK